MTRGVRIDWGHVVDRAADVVRSYDTSVTLRQLFYRLVSAQEIPNTESAYKNLSRVTAKARREGSFPDLIDRGRQIHRRAWWDSPADAIAAVRDQYRLDRTTGQDVSVYLGVEKAGMVVQLQAWFGHLGVPILALGGYSSQTYVQDILDDVESAGRPAVLLYAGDFDPSGEDIDRDFVERADCWHRVVRVALDVEQVREHELPVNPGKTSDSRAAGFIARHGELVQVELDALPPETLRSLYADALAAYWDASTYERVLAQERIDQSQIQDALDSINGDDSWPAVSSVGFVPASQKEKRGGLLGYVTCVLGDVLLLDGMTLRRTADGRHAMSFPSRTDKQGRRHPYFRPLDDRARRIIEKAIFDVLGIPAEPTEGRR